MKSRLGRYSVLKHLASGGMADVLLARTDGIEGFERHVVLKRIRQEYAHDQRFIRMFLDEARLAANLHHQHIVQVNDIGEADGEYFFAMEYIHGEDVRAILSAASRSRAHVPLPITIAIVSAAASGLHYAHERRGSDKQPLGIVHRDVSPSNILVGYDGSIKVLDFGIAKASMHEETRSGSLKGKLSYVAPEQCKGTAVDRRTDVYSLGVVLYELATTSRLIKGDNDFDMMDQIVHGRITLPQVRRPDLPRELASIIMCAISADREQRFFSADELRVALDQFAERSGLTATTSALQAYMRKQFGERPEPWLELDGFDDLAIAVEPAPPRSTWTDARVSGQFRSGSMPRQTGPHAVEAGGRPAESPKRATPPNTMQSPRVGLSGAAKVALACVPALVAILCIAIWRLTVAVPSTATQVASSPSVSPINPAPPEASPPAAAPIAAPQPSEATVRSVSSPAAPGRNKSRPATTRRSAATHSAAVSASQASAKVEPVEAVPEEPTPEPAVAAAPIAAPAPKAEPSPPIVVPTTPVAPARSVPAPPANTAQNVTPRVLDANRIGGDKSIVPDEVTQAAIGRAGADTITASYKLCVAVDGKIDTVSRIKSSGFPEYDSKIVSTIRGEWRYRPFLINGKPAVVCTVLRFAYSQK